MTKSSTAATSGASNKRLYVVTDTTTKQITLADAQTPAGALRMVVQPRFEVHVATPAEVLRLLRDAPDTTVLQSGGEDA